MSARKVNRWLGIIVPAVEVLIFIYAAYVMTGEVAVNWLLNPPVASTRAARPGAAIAILVIFYLLLVFALASLVRILIIQHTDPGYIPTKSEQPRSQKSGRHGRDVELGALDATARPFGTNPDPVEFYSRDAFVCNPNGWPLWCDRCQSFKPDRVHHSTDVGRCVRGFDHFCPWAGGVISEYNHKFFNLFVMYTALLCIEIIITNGIFVHEQLRDGLASGHTFVTMAVLIGFAAFFGLFTAAMTVTHFIYAFQNTNTVESLQNRNMTYVAVHVGWPGPLQHVKADIINYPLGDTGKSPTRAFAILKVEPGTNIYDIGWWRNWRLTMGVYAWEWFLPILPSPQSNICKKYGLNQDYPFSDGMAALRQKWLQEHEQ